jgi:hypothetical protein
VKANKTKLLKFRSFDIIILSNTCLYDVIFSISVQNLSPSVILISFKLVSRCSCKISQSLMGLSPYNLIIRSMKLSPCFLNKNDPKFISISLRKHWRSIFTWNEIIDDNQLLNSILGHLEAKDTLFIDFVTFKKFSHSVWVFSQNTDRT